MSHILQNSALLSLNVGDLVRHFPTLPLQLTVTLYKRGQFWHGPDVATYILECSADCNAKGGLDSFHLRLHAYKLLIFLNIVAIVLLHMDRNGKPSITMCFFATIAENPTQYLRRMRVLD